MVGHTKGEAGTEDEAVEGEAVTEGEAGREGVMCPIMRTFYVI